MGGAAGAFGPSMIVTPRVFSSLSEPCPNTGAIAAAASSMQAATPNEVDENFRSIIPFSRPLLKAR